MWKVLSAMIVYPAMELIGGRCVRLSQGRFDRASAYCADPVDAVLGLEAAGAEWVHLVDLDGAREGGPRQHGLIADIALSVSIKLQVAGGFREAEHLQRVFDAGVDRVVIDRLATEQPQRVRELIAEFGNERIALALDVIINGEAPLVATASSSPRSARSLWDVAKDFPEVRHLLLTDIGRKRTMRGANLPLIEEAAKRLPHVSLQASGGVSSLDDLRALKSAGAAGAIVGEALWERKIDLAEAVQTACA
ncbi:MAG TPA: 1-(5-phosphoribosyl)-5-[(5-phosphoribosylamino)methylideneamino] imidazole-4-carboxamide isomerase [Allosphingosinicella sp.]|nr:1-(5-phosphoribosyl)-5-[(5-phosphoribosylamino)methylideneamino] imidazole-4-carboxamide isomerase [Allosphingosinicella sp.]